MKRYLLLVAVMMFCGVSLSFGADAPTQRQKDLRAILTALQSGGSSSEEHPGWRDTNKVARLETFIRENTNTDEGFVGEIWLALINTYLDRPVERPAPHSQRKGAIETRVARLNTIISTASNQGTVKAATLTKAMLLFEADDWTGSAKVADDIFKHIHDYDSESDEQFLYLLHANDTSASGIEPMLREMLLVSDCLRGDLKSALDQATYIRNKFPEFGKKIGIDGTISQLTRGQSPYYRPVGTGLPPFFDRLGLSTDQEEKIKSVLADMREKMMAFRADHSLSPEDHRVKMKALKDATDAKLKEILSAYQYAKLQEMRGQALQQLSGRAAGKTAAKADE